MADTVTLLRRGDPDAAEQIIQAFAEQTGLSAREAEDGRVFEIEGSEHSIDIVQTLNGIDAAWEDHVALQMPS
jgi:hypothetical protein